MDINAIQKQWNEWKKNRLEINRPTWEHTFLTIAYEIAKRSHDAQTQCGAVVVNKNNRILGLGYNGFIRKINDNILPNIRPFKYDFMLHAELSSIMNCEHRPENGTIFTTGKPCLHCLQVIYQAGINKIVYDKNQIINMHDKEYEKKYDGLLYLLKNKIEIIPYNYRGKN